MKQSTPQFTDTIPRDYDTYLGPFLFEPFAADLASRLSSGSTGSLLETTCGTGVSTVPPSRPARGNFHHRHRCE